MVCNSGGPEGRKAAVEQISGTGQGDADATLWQTTRAFVVGALPDNGRCSALRVEAAMPLGQEVRHQQATKWLVKAFQGVGGEASE